MLFFAFVAAAQAANICSLTQAQVTGVLNYYGASQFTYQEVLPYIASPIDCATYGDLCEEVGASHATTFLCNRWTDLKNHVAVSTVRANAEAELEAMQEARIDELFPSGIPSGAVWWGRRRATI